MPQAMESLYGSVGRLADVRAMSAARLPQGDLLFGTVRRFGALGYKIAHPLRRRRHPFDAIGGLGALNDGALSKRLQRLG